MCWEGLCASELLKRFALLLVCVCVARVFCFVLMEHWQIAGICAIFHRWFYDDINKAKRFMMLRSLFNGLRSALARLGRDEGKHAKLVVETIKHIKRNKMNRVGLWSFLNAHVYFK